MAHKRPTDAIKHIKQAGGKLAEARDKLKNTLDGLHGRKPEAAKKIVEMIDFVEKQREKLGEIVRFLESDSIP